MNFNLNIESATLFGSIAFYGNVWLIEFRDYTRAIVIEDDGGTENFVLDEPELE